jgi:hypothetical protein
MALKGWGCEQVAYSLPLLLNQIFVPLSGLKDLIPNLLRVNAHAASWCNLQCFQAVRSFDELSFFRLDPLGALVFPK